VYKRIFKRWLDVTGAIVLLILFLPILLIVALLLYIDNKGAILFIQQRPGKDERLFYLYKFKTLKDDPKNVLSDKQRVTKLGDWIRKSSLDEFPQLINVLKGEMSLIGPRPLLQEYLTLYSKDQKQRHNVLPGITGLAQVNGRNTLSWEEKFKWDIEYAEKIDFWLDFTIILKSIFIIFSQIGVYEKNGNSVEKFKGNSVA
jgi:undecaprenyl phosphate N,N'-diacetylbacillosamine 1-phosphate transferase